ncbi:hypothetical protein BKK79_24535 [Cupriavidus sp. USMAA2-4]|uniref:Hpt domain-containing protein n=1 Tax=unclassified Cupriavidus TaxID=2640874 RepID=UPI0008A671D2|nr:MULTISPECIES: Hpt domain-containing protein [unclassified Cupriavidus]AOY95005.1 hypothetical protein BKK79_24535 [Cupriavidus sp. USMAA2-4]AOZ02099.1 hypothetical protein BKK81_22555 [Cupriavidus sp. USMAHM13]
MASAPDSAAAAQRQLQRLRERFLAGLPGRADELARAVEAWAASAAAEAAPETAAQARLAAAAVLHRLAGAAGLHGLAPLGAQARALEDAVMAAAAPSPALLATLAGLRATLSTLATPAGPGGTSGADADGLAG